ncbi:MAG: HlyD family secretion protein, partial [Planctomycetota bacterium]
AKALQSTRLLAEESAQLEETLQIQKETLELTKSQIARLEIRAPIDGVILGWNIDRRYSGRPLERGTLLFSVANPDAERQLDLKVPTKRAGYIREAFVSAEAEQGQTKLRFSLASQPDRVFDGQLIHVNAGLEEDSDLGYVLKMKGSPLEEMPADMKNGIPVIAKVHCGRESFFYCKSYEFLDWLNRTTFEYF